MFTTIVLFATAGLGAALSIWVALTSDPPGAHAR